MCIKTKNGCHGQPFENSSRHLRDGEVGYVKVSLESGGGIAPVEAASRGRSVVAAVEERGGIGRDLGQEGEGAIGRHHEPVVVGDRGVELLVGRSRLGRLVGAALRGPLDLALVARGLARVALGLVQVGDELVELGPDHRHDLDGLAVPGLAGEGEVRAQALEGVDADLAGQALEHLRVEAEAAVQTVVDLVADRPERTLHELLVGRLGLSVALFPPVGLGDHPQEELDHDREGDQVPERVVARLVDRGGDQRAVALDLVVARLLLLVPLAVGLDDEDGPLVEPLVFRDLGRLGRLALVGLVARVGFHDLGHQRRLRADAFDGHAPLGGEVRDERIGDVRPQLLRDLRPAVAGGGRRRGRGLLLRRLAMSLLLTHDTTCFLASDAVGSCRNPLCMRRVSQMT